MPERKRFFYWCLALGIIFYFIGYNFFLQLALKGLFYALEWRAYRVNSGQTVLYIGKEIRGFLILSLWIFVLILQAVVYSLLERNGPQIGGKRSKIWSGATEVGLQYNQSIRIFTAAFIHISHLCVTFLFSTWLKCTYVNVVQRGLPPH